MGYRVEGQKPTITQKTQSVLTKPKKPSRLFRFQKNPKNPVGGK